MSVQVSERQKQFIDEIIIKEGFKKYEVNFRPVCLKKDGYLGIITLIDVKEKSTKKTLHLVMKAAYTTESIRSIISIRRAYERENLIYSVIFKDFTELQEEFKIEDKFEGIAKYYGGLSETREECIIVENLMEKGFYLWKREVPMESQHVSAVFMQYGRLHALSYAMKILKPKLYKERAKHFPHFLIGERKNKYVDEIFMFFEDKASEAVRGSDEASEAVGRFSHGFQEYLSYLSKYPDQFNVLLHGDCWCSNIMFRSKDLQFSGPSQVYLQEWHLSSIGPPVRDLVTFFFACSSKDCLKNYMNYLNIYHKSLTKMLKQFGIRNEEIISFKELLIQWKIFARYGLFIALMAIKLMLSEPEEVVEPKNSVTVDTLSDILLRKISNNEAYLRRIRAVIDCMIHNELI